MKISATRVSPRARPRPARSLDRQGGAINSGTPKTEACTNHQSHRQINSFIVSFDHLRAPPSVFGGDGTHNMTMVRHFTRDLCSAKETTVCFLRIFGSWLSRGIRVIYTAFVFPQFVRWIIEEQTSWFWSPHHRKADAVDGLRGRARMRKE